MSKGLDVLGYTVFSENEEEMPTSSQNNNNPHLRISGELVSYVTMSNPNNLPGGLNPWCL